MRRYASHAGLSRMRVDDHFVRYRRGVGRLMEEAHRCRVVACWIPECYRIYDMCECEEAFRGARRLPCWRVRVPRMRGDDFVSAGF